MPYSITQHFNTQEELFQFVAMMEKQKKIENKKVNKESDNRGKHMATLHSSARLLHLEHPERTYKECMKSIA
jgi:hypothetical protein